VALDHYSSAVPVIGTADVAGTISYFEKTLGFKQQWIWGEPPVYAGVKAGGALLYICHDPKLASAIRERQLTPDIFLWVRDIGSIYEQHRAQHADITEELTERPWGVRQYVIREPNGYHLKIAESIEPENE
jgi:catechol 2,3-dioxygenase-like lactoylglutathione lyase family enzyme